MDGHREDDTPSSEAISGLAGGRSPPFTSGNDSINGISS
jgi:hypothetical protein